MATAIRIYPKKSCVDVVKLCVKGNGNMKKFQKILPKVWGYGIAFLGIALIFLSLCIAKYCSEHLVEQILSSLGCSLFCLGIITCLIDLKDWKNYFADRVKDIVLEYSYLACLDEYRLKELQTKVYQARFKGANLDLNNSFYGYYQKSIESLINDPFRDNVKQELIISIVNQDTIKVVDKVSYVCRSNGNIPMPSVQFAYSEKENAEIISHSVSIKYPLGCQHAGAIEEISPEETFDPKTKIYFMRYNLADKMQDGLIVIKESIHEMNVEEFQTWEMAHVTRNFTFIAKFPCEYGLQFKPFVLRPELGRETSVSGYFNYEYESWMLPKNGITWKLYKIKEKEKITKACIGDK